MLTATQVREHMCHVLVKNTRKVGLTYGELSTKCGKQWRDAIPTHSGISAKRARVEHVTKFVYDQWKEGNVVIEPPRPGQRSARIWHPTHASKKFTSAVIPEPIPATNGKPSTVTNGVATTATLRQAYNHFLPEHPSGAVNIFKIRRFLGWRRQKFDLLVESLACQRNPPIQFVGGDPQAYSEEQRNDSFLSGGDLYFSILWRQ